jgi:hypothetical protein
VNLMLEQSLLDAEARRRALEWLAKLDRSEGVGSKHHTVPGFYLRRFASKSGRLSVRNRTTGELRGCNYLDLRIKDFYTVVGEDGALDGRLEQALCIVEANAGRIFADLLSPFRRPRPLDPVDQAAVVQFLAFQLTRGLRKRRELELMADYTAKLQAGQQLTRREIESLNVMPHPNLHLEMMCKTAEHLAPYISDRPVALIVLDRPLLITSDEPVMLNLGENHVVHQPDCFITKKELARRRREADGAYSQIIHIYPSRPSGVAKAMEIALPLTPRSIMFLGPPGASSEPYLSLRGDEADRLACEANNNVISQALDWVAANPEHPTFPSLDFPPPDPLIQVCDGGSAMSQKLKTPPEPRMPRLLRHWR